MGQRPQASLLAGDLSGRALNVPVSVPPELASRRRLGADWARWLDRLPQTSAQVCTEWELTPDGDPCHGHCSLVLPVRTRAGAAAVLKIGFDGDEESSLEALALTRWAGPGVVDLLRADPARRALLLERLGTEDLSHAWDVAACELIGERYRTLHRPAGPQFARLSDRLADWEPNLRALLGGGGVPRRMVEHALSLVRQFRTDEATDGALLHFDLHYGNVLRTLGAEVGSTDPADWVVIDPKPVSGDPHAEVAPLLVNRFEELAGEVRGGLRRRFEAVVDAAGFDEDRARDWVIVRMMLNISWAVSDLGDRMTAVDREWVTRCLTVAKAVQ